MKIAISGSTGFIGASLSQYLAANMYEVVAIKRELLQHDHEEELVALIETCDAVINLAGAPINNHWTYNYKKELYESRIFTTRKIVSAINRTRKCKLFISASAVGYYDSEECHDENATSKGGGFLSELCLAWEKEALKTAPEVRLAILRLGVVLAPDGGGLKQMIFPLKTFGIGVIIGDGSQPLSWVDRDDLLRAILFIINTDTLYGIINLTAPEQLTQRQFTQILANHYGRLFVMSIPAFLIQFLYGEASEFILDGQCVLPKRLIEKKFQFISPSLKSYLQKKHIKCKQKKETL